MKTALAAILILLLSGCAQQPSKVISSPDGRFVIEANDEGFYSGGERITGVSVKKGTEVAITFKVLEEKVYYAGIAFKGCGEISPDVPKGGSFEMRFTPQSSCSILSYWPEDGTPKKTLQVVVE